MATAAATGTKRTHETMKSGNVVETGAGAGAGADAETSVAIKTGNTNNGNTKKSEPVVSASSSPYISMFENFRAELDEHHDRRERVIKASKDITANSKKIIFALQRVKQLNQPLTAGDTRISADVSRLQKSTDDLFTTVSADLKSVNTYRYYRNISGGLQEFMEAVLFRHYLEQQRLMTYDEAQATVPSGVMLTYEDYLLGVFDVTGEMMRFAITCLATMGRMPDAGSGNASILADLQTLRAELEALDVQGSYGLQKEFEGKLRVTKQSVEKVENGVYGMIVRGKERPPGWMPDVSERREEQESY